MLEDVKQESKQSSATMCPICKVYGDENQYVCISCRNQGWYIGACPMNKLSQKIKCNCVAPCECTLVREE